MWASCHPYLKTAVLQLQQRLNGHWQGRDVSFPVINSLEIQSGDNEWTGKAKKTELTGHLKNHQFKRKITRHLPVTSWHLRGDMKWPASCKESSGTFHSLWCILKIELLITVQYKSRMTNMAITSAALISHCLYSSGLPLPQKKYLGATTGSNDEIADTWAVQAETHVKHLCFDQDISFSAGSSRSFFFFFSQP